jgi:hypothetical protein
MNHITKAHIKKAMKEHHMIGKMLGDKTLDKKTHKKATREHHFLGSLIGMLAKGAGMAAPYLAKGLSLGAKGLGAVGGTLARNAGNIGHAVNAAGTAAQAGMAFNQMRQANKSAAAQERMMNAQAQGAEDQNAYLKKKMEAEQVQKRGGRTKSHRRH